MEKENLSVKLRILVRIQKYFHSPFNTLKMWRRKKEEMRKFPQNDPTEVKPDVHAT